MRHAILPPLALATIVAGAAVSANAADALSANAPISGGTAGLARALHVDPVPDRASFVTELTRVIYNAPEGKSATADALLVRLAKHLDVVGRFQASLAAVQPEGGTITLVMAGQKNNRSRLRGFLDLVGLKLREKNGTFSVERTDNKQAAERLRLLADLGVDLAQLATRLNDGEAVRVELPTETVPVPLTAALWSTAVFRRPVALPALVSAIIADRQAALVCHGLAALDDETLRFLADRPALLTRLYEHDAGPFAAFAGSLWIRGGNIEVPGGAAAVPLWEALVDEKVARPDRFIRELFAKDDGRVVYLYDAVSHLDPSRAAFALGSSVKDLSIRTDRFKALAATLTSNTQLDFKARPFTRAPNDTVLLLTRVRARPDGAPATPAWRQFWSRVFDGIDLPDNPVSQLKNLQEDGIVDASWFAEALQNADLRFRAERLDQIDFGHRVFGSADERALPDALVALRAFPRYRMLMLTLERMGVRRPSVYAVAARHASRLSSLDANHGFVALAQFQASLALVARMAGVHTIDAPAAEALVVSLSAVPLTGDGRYAGAIARWALEKLSAEVGGSADLDAAIIAALAGPRGVRDAPPVSVTWEDRRYRLDLVTPEVHRLTRMREKLAGPSVQLALDLVRTADALSGASLTHEQLKPLMADLGKASDALAPPPKKKKEAAPAVLPPGVDPPKNAREVVNKAIQNLSKIGTPKDVKNAAHAAEPLYEVIDEVLADAVMSLAYAVDLGDPEGDALFAGNVSRRHDFGFTEHASEMRARAEWAQPVQVAAAGVAWHVTGSVLGLDLALSSLALRRIATDKVGEPPTLTIWQRDIFSQTVALINPLDLRDADRDAIADAIDRGRRRVDPLDTSGAGLDALADAVRMDGWRRRAIRWSLANEPGQVRSFFSLSELLQLGHPDPAAALDPFGMAALTVDGCVCTELPAPGAWTTAMGRAEGGFLPPYVADLNLHVLLTLRELHLPAALARGVLAAAMQDYIDEVKPIEADDWLTLVRAAQKVPRERIEDYVAALTADGPLVPESATSIGKDR